MTDLVVIIFRVLPKERVKRLSGIVGTSLSDMVPKSKMVP